MVSSKARTQRKARANAPNHAKRKMCASHLSDELRKEYGARTARICRGDTVAILRGDEDIRGIEGKVLDVDMDTGRVTIEGTTSAKADGTEVARTLHASNLVITKLNMEDQWRKDSLARKGVTQ